MYSRTSGAVLKGAPEMIARLRGIASDFQNKQVRAVQRQAKQILEKAKQLVPYDTGKLHDSGTVGEPTRTGSNQFSIRITCAIMFGGDNVTGPYATAVHEHLSNASPPTWQANPNIHWTKAGTGPKFLERPLLEAAGTLAKKWGEDLKL